MTDDIVPPWLLEDWYEPVDAWPERPVRIVAVQGDLTEQRVDAVVNPANRALRGGGGVDGKIHRRGGEAIARDCAARYPNGLQLGEAGWSTAGELPARWVIHTVGPHFRDESRTAALLRSCYRQALRIADTLGATTVAFPVLGTGGHGWPRALALELALDTLLATSTYVDTVRVVAFDKPTYDQLRAELLLRCPSPVAAKSVGSLFDQQPPYFGYRGDVYLWRELRAQFATTSLPQHAGLLWQTLQQAIEQIIGEPLERRVSADEHDPSVHVPAFNPGHGMSAGLVDIPWWAHTGLPFLLHGFLDRSGHRLQMTDDREPPRGKSTTATEETVANAPPSQLSHLTTKTEAIPAESATAELDDDDQVRIQCLLHMNQDQLVGCWTFHDNIPQPHFYADEVMLKQAIESLGIETLGERWSDDRLESRVEHLATSANPFTTWHAF